MYYICIMKQLRVDISKTISQAEYARLKKISRQAVNQQVQKGLLKLVEVGGRKLIILQ